MTNDDKTQKDMRDIRGQQRDEFAEEETPHINLNEIDYDKLDPERLIGDWIPTRYRE